MNDRIYTFIAGVIGVLFFSGMLFIGGSFTYFGMCFIFSDGNLIVDVIITVCGVALCGVSIFFIAVFLKNYVFGDENYERV